MGERSAIVAARLRHLPPQMTNGLWGAQIEAIENLERSFTQDRLLALNLERAASDH